MVSLTSGRGDATRTRSVTETVIHLFASFGHPELSKNCQWLHTTVQHVRTVFASSRKPVFPSERRLQFSLPTEHLPNHLKSRTRTSTRLRRGWFKNKNVYHIRDKFLHAYIKWNKIFLNVISFREVSGACFSPSSFRNLQDACIHVSSVLSVKLAAREDASGAIVFGLRRVSRHIGRHRVKQNSCGEAARLARREYLRFNSKRHPKRPFVTRFSRTGVIELIYPAAKKLNPPEARGTAGLLSSTFRAGYKNAKLTRQPSGEASHGIQRPRSGQERGHEESC